MDNFGAGLDAFIWPSKFLTVNCDGLLGWRRGFWMKSDDDEDFLYSNKSSVFASCYRCVVLVFVN